MSTDNKENIYTQESIHRIFSDIEDKQPHQASRPFGHREANPNLEALFTLFGQPALEKKQLKSSVELFIKWQIEECLGK
jgi:hypothetical protein